MSKRLIFYGYSDDVAYCDIKTDKGTSYTDKDTFEKTAVARVTDDEGGCLVMLRYAPNNLVGTWAIGISQLDEEIDLPEWAKHPEFDSEGYSVIMRLSVPDDAKVEWVDKDDKN